MCSQPFKIIGEHTKSWIKVDLVKHEQWPLLNGEMTGNIKFLIDTFPSHSVSVTSR